MASTHDIIRAIGRRDLATAVGVGLSAVDNALIRGTMPSAWYFAVAAICAERGVPCPPEAFNFKSPSVSRTRPSAEAS